MAGEPPELGRPGAGPPRRLRWSQPCPHLGLRLGASSPWERTFLLLKPPCVVLCYCNPSKLHPTFLKDRARRRSAWGPQRNYKHPLRLLTTEGFPAVVQATKLSSQQLTAGRQRVAPWGPGKVLSAQDTAGASLSVSSLYPSAGVVPDSNGFLRCLRPFMGASSATDEYLARSQTGRPELPGATVLGSSPKSVTVTAGGQRPSSLAEQLRNSGGDPHSTPQALTVVTGPRMHPALAPLFPLSFPDAS